MPSLKKKFGCFENSKVWRFWNRQLYPNLTILGGFVAIPGNSFPSKNPRQIFGSTPLITVNFKKPTLISWCLILRVTLMLTFMLFLLDLNTSLFNSICTYEQHESRRTYEHIKSAWLKYRERESKIFGYHLLFLDLFSFWRIKKSGFSQFWLLWKILQGA